MNPWCHHEELFWKQWFWLNYGDLTGWKESQCEFTDCQIGSEIFSCVDRGRTAWNIDVTVHSQLPVRHAWGMSVWTRRPLCWADSVGDGVSQPLIISTVAVSAPHHWHWVSSRYEWLGGGQATARLFQACLSGKAPRQCGEPGPLLRPSELLSQAGSLLAAGVSALSYSSHWSLLSAHHLCGGKSVCAFQTQTFSDLLGKNSSLSWTGTI